MITPYFALEGIHISLPTHKIFEVGPLAVTNSLLLGMFGVAVMIAVFGYVARKVRRGQYNRFVGVVQWAFEGLYDAVYDIVPDRKMARSIAPLALTIFFTVLFTYWISIIPGVGESITWNGAPLLRGLPTDLNFTLALATVTMVSVQIYAVRVHGFFGNLGRYFISPLKNPIGTFEGFLELVGEMSRLIALSLRLFGNAFAGEVLLVIVTAMSSYAATVTLPFFMGFELFIGFIQAYVFYMLTLIFAALATAAHGEHHEPAHVTLITSEEVPASK